MVVFAALSSVLALGWQASTASLVAGPFAGRTPLRAVVRAVVDDKAEVEEYFNNEGFNRWNRIYSEDGEVNSVQLDIRTGHAETVEKVLGWVDADGSAKAGETFCDAGCGVGSLAIPLATRGATVVASDISEAMANEAAERANAAGVAERATFSTSDLEALSGKYDTVTCIDVMIHYPPEKMAEMVKHLASVADKRLIISFAPDTWYYRTLKSIGGLFPGPSKTTRAYLHPEEAVVNALLASGFKLERTEMTGTSFYFSRLLEAVRE
jgi:magnesium-protoporphyrin O-methyltransferase